MAGTVLWLMGEGLQFASVVALTVSFGLGLSATIHFLNRLRLEDKPGADPAIGVERATVLVGPALILTSVVLACGLAVTVFSDLPSLRLFGWLQRLRDAGGADRRPPDPAADGDVPQSAGAAVQGIAAGPLGRPIVRGGITSRAPARSRLPRSRCPASGSITVCELPLVADRQRRVEAHARARWPGCCPPVALPASEPKTPRRGLVPRAGDVAAVVGDVARQLELVAVAGAAQVQSEAALPAGAVTCRGSGCVRSIRSAR